MTKKSKIAYITLGLVLAGSIAATSVTFALFATSDKTDQIVYPDGGHVKRTIFLDCGTTWDFDNPAFYAYVWKQGSNPLVYSYEPLSETSVTSYSGNDHLYSFSLDTVKYDHFTFIRHKDDGSSPGSANWWDKDDNHLWGKTNDIVYNTANNTTYYNLYKITSYNSTGVGLSGYSYGYLDSDGRYGTVINNGVVTQGSLNTEPSTISVRVNASTEWVSNSAETYIWAWGDSLVGKWYSLSFSNKVGTLSVDKGVSYLRFCRFNPGRTKPTVGSTTYGEYRGPGGDDPKDIWNQISDQTIQSGKQITISSYDSASWNWY